jgi:DNA polymerase IV
MHLTPPSSIAWLFLDLNSYFASVEQQLNPAYRGRPLVVVPLETDATSAIAASYEAKAYGIKTGTRIYEAKRLCPDLVCAPAHHEHYVDFHHRIIEEIQRHIPVTYVASIDEMACALDSTERNIEVAIALAQRIKKGIKQHLGECIRCSIGLAPNIFLAKIATNMQKPDGLVVIEPQDIPHKLYTVPFEDITGIGRNMQYRLHQAGISTMQQLYQLSPKHMRALWHSVEGERFYYKLRGIQLEREESTRHSVGHSHVLSPENRPTPQAKLIGKRLLQKAVSRMRRLDYAATTMSVSVRIEAGNKYFADIRFKPLYTHADMAKHFETLWNNIISQSRITSPRIKKVAVTLHGLVAISNIQPDLFDDSTMQQLHVKNEQLSTAMDRLNQRFGRGTIITAATLSKANTVTGTKIAFSRIPDKQEFKE